MCLFRNIHILIIIYGLVQICLEAKADVNATIYSIPHSKNNEDYIVVEVGHSLDIWCELKQPQSLKGMHLNYIDFNNYDPKSKKLLHVNWQDDLKWDPKMTKVQTSNNFTSLQLHISSVENKHAGWHICFINEHVYKYLYVFVKDGRSVTNNDEYRFIKSKSNDNTTLPCVPSTPDVHVKLYKSINYSYQLDSYAEVPLNAVSYNPSIGFDVKVHNHTKFICNFFKNGTQFNSTITVIKVDEYDKHFLSPIFNEEFSSIVREGFNIKMECIFINYKNMNVSLTWDTRSLMIIEKQFRTSYHENQIKSKTNTTIHTALLEIEDVSENEIIPYRCSLFDSKQTEIGFADRQLYKKATAVTPPIIIEFGNRKNINENESYLVNCKASYPISWTFEQSENKNNNPKNMYITSSLIRGKLKYQSTLEIHKATSENTGNYYCLEKYTFFRDTSSISQKIFIAVLKDKKYHTFVPYEKVTTLYVPKYTNEILFPCKPLSANTFTDMTGERSFWWYANYLTIKGRTILRFESPLQKEWIFDCRFNNLWGNITDFSTIIIKPQETFEESTLPIINMKYNESVKIGEELEINCTIVQYCKACNETVRLNIQWKYDDLNNLTQRIHVLNKFLPLPNAEYYFSSLIVKDVQKTDSLEYECVAGNLASIIKVIIDTDESLYSYWEYILTNVTISTFILIIIGTILQKNIRKANIASFSKGTPGHLVPEINISLQADMLPYDTNLEIPKNNIKIGEQLGFGNYGIVYKGEILGQVPLKTVAIKMVKSNLKYTYIKSLIYELKILSILGKHLNVVNLLGACTENIQKMELLVVLEYCHYGNIRDYLFNNRNNFVNLINVETDEILPHHTDLNSIEITTNSLINWAYQISCGMQFIVSRKVLHGDLAARNILLSANNIVKICDFGLSKNLYSYQTYKKKTQCPLPIKWMAIESIRDKTFSTKSDIWSFAIVLWELFSLAETPYPDLLENMDFFKIVNDGYRMKKPEYSTIEIYKIMLKCWEHNPENRPSFTLLTKFLETLLEKNFRNYYMDLSEEFKIQNQHKKNIFKAIM